MLSQIEADIFQVRLPLPFALSIVNCYLIRGGDGWTVVDTGLNTADGREAWEEVFRLLEIRTGQIEKIILTHMHPDHLGMAGWLQQRLKSNGPGSLPPVFASPREAELFELFWQEHVDWRTDLTQFWKACGVPAEMGAEMTESTAVTRRRTLPHPENVQIIDVDRPLVLGDRVCRAILMPGHSDGQLIFYDADDRLLFSGDHILLKITPNIGLWPSGEPDPLGRYLATFEHLKRLEVRLSLPGHRSNIVDLRARISELAHHHKERLDHTVSAADPQATVYEAGQQIFPFERLSVHEKRFAIAETLAHLERLVCSGRLRRRDEDSWIYQPI